MALDKQKILNDLGNVVNQLQSADCGCMGKLFGQGQGQGMASPGYGCGGCCRRGCGHPCSGEPYTMGQGMPAQGRPNMGYCNPAQSYADGYQFMNQNVMQPVIKEVYDDLKSLNSGNTITNNPLGARMGLTPGAPMLPCEGMSQNAQMGNMDPGGQNMLRGHPMMQHMAEGQQMPDQMPGGQQMSGGHQMYGGQQMSGGHQMYGGHQMSGGHQMYDGQQMSGGHEMPGGQQMSGTHQMPCGQQMSGNANRLENFNKMFPGIVQGQGGGLSYNPMEIAMQMNPALAKQQPGMETTQNPMSSGGAMNPEANPMHAQANSSYQAMTHQQNANNAAASSQQANQMAYAANTGGQLPPNFPPQGNSMQNMVGAGNQNTRMGRMNTNQGGHGNYGQHTAGVSKFKEMFPGVMQGLGDVNFDPMEIAIQMNPANKQVAAMNSMQKLMSSKPLEPNAAAMTPVINGMNAVNANFSPNQGAPESQTQLRAPEQTTNVIPSVQPQQYATNQVPPNQQQEYATNPVTTTNQHQMQEPQQVYTAVTDSQGHQQVPQQGIEQPYQETTQEVPMSQGYPNQVPGGRVYEKEPIYPVDNSRYNTIGQPIELLQVTKDHRSDVPNFRQTPARLRNNAHVYNNVKSTVSKTSLLRQPGGPGRTPSRIQMQQVYNQYKGSQSYTNQNVREPVQGQSASDGRLNAAPPIEQRHIPVERVGGDTIVNNQAYNEPVKGGHEVGQVGDVVTNKPRSRSPDVPMTGKTGNLRNGLQDMVYTAYPQSTAWSFHGRGETGRPTHGYRDFRVRV